MRQKLFRKRFSIADVVFAATVQWVVQVVFWAAVLAE